MIDEHDLHGYTVQRAFEWVQYWINEAHRDGVRRLKIITGKSGQIHHEFPFWMENNPKVSSIHETNGSFVVKVKKK